MTTDRIDTAELERIALVLDRGFGNPTFAERHAAAAALRELVALRSALAVPDDVAELLEDIQADECTGDIRSYLAGRIIATIEAQAAELARLKEENALMAASLDEEERKHGLSTNGGMWRFWSQQLREYHDRRAKDRAALSHPDKEPTA